ncbi:MAG: hypothetical protein RSA78_01955 [Oscillospiraceae bacterium]
MKKTKLIAVFTAAVLALTLASCGAKKSPSTSQSGSSALDNSSQSGSSTPADSSQSGSTPDSVSTMKFGKISTVVGNELSLLYCEAPDAFKDTQFFGNAPTQDEEIKDDPHGTTVMEAATMTPATAADPAAGGDVTINKPDKNEAPFEVKLNGEKDDLTVPTGIEIADMTGKGRTSIADIKDGDVVGVDLRDGKVYGIVLFS